MGLTLLDASNLPDKITGMRSIAFIIALALTAGCRPDYLSSAAPRPGFSEMRQAADRLSDAIMSGAPESDDAALFAALTRAAERSRSQGACDADLALFAAGYLREAGARFADDAARSAARQRALRGARRWILPAHPEAARFLP